MLKLQGLSSKPVNSTGNKLLLDVLAELVVELELGLDVFVNIIIVVGGWCCRVEEVEE